MKNVHCVLFALFVVALFSFSCFDKVGFVSASSCAGEAYEAPKASCSGAARVARRTPIRNVFEAKPLRSVLTRNAAGCSGG